MTTPQPGAPIPPALRALLPTHHPARTIPCPWCRAPTGTPCHGPATHQRKPQPHPARITTWARTVAVCPTCQVEPGVECHLDGRPLHGDHIHPARQQEAERTTT